MDDIVIFSTTFNQHIQDLEAVFKCLRKSNISLKASKCVIASNKVDFLGYELSVFGIKPQKCLTEAINLFQHPESKHEMKRCLGLTGSYKNFIPHFADIAHHLN